MSSSNRPSGTVRPTVPGDLVPQEIHTALFSIINQINALSGYGMKLQTSAELDPVIRVWYKHIQAYRIPLDAYEEILDEMIRQRTRDINEGRKEKQMDAFLFLATWDRLIKRRRQDRLIKDGNIITDSARTDCPRCLGIPDMPEVVYDETGRSLGAIPGVCKHRPLVRGEWLERRRQEGKV